MIKFAIVTLCQWSTSVNNFVQYSLNQRRNMNDEDLGTRSSLRSFQIYEDEEYDPHLYRQVQHPTTNVETLIHILKGCVGTGILCIPKGFNYVGSVAGIIGMITIALLAGYCIYLLVNASYNICKITQYPQLSYGDSMKAGFRIGPRRLKKYAKLSGIVIDTVLISYQIGICSVYIVFVSTNTKGIVDEYIKLPLFMYYAILFLPFCLTIFLRTLKILAPISFISTIFAFVSFGICAYYIFQDIPPISERPMFKDLSKYPLFIGLTMFSMEAVGVVIATEHHMKTPKAFLHYPGIFYIGHTIIVIVYTTVGFFGYWKYGDDIEPSITLNLPIEEIPAKIARALYAASIFLSYPLQAFPGIKILWDSYIIRRINPKKRILYDYMLRFGFLLMTYIFAMGVPMLELIISLVGCIGLSTVGLIFPPILDCLAKYPDRFGFCKWIVVKNMILSMFGIFCFITGTYFTILEIMNFNYEATIR